MMHAVASFQYSMHHGELSRLRREYPHPASDKQACRSSGGVCEVDSMSKLIEPHLIGLHNYDARCCIIIMERYRSGHNGADSKSVCAKSTRGFESLSLRQKARSILIRGCFFAFSQEYKQEFVEQLATTGCLSIPTIYGII